MSWTGLPATQTTDWSQVDYFNQFVDAIVERESAATPYNESILPLAESARVVAGDDVGKTTAFQVPGSIFNLQRGLERAAGIHVFEDGIDDMASDAGAPHAPGLLSDVARLATEVGNAIPADTTVSFPNIFTRKWPREIATTGDAGESGWRARHQSDAAFYEHDGTAWSLAADQATPADTLEGRGYIVAGDYIGPWIWNELWAVAKAMKWCIIDPVSVLETGYEGDGSSLNSPSSNPDYDANASESLAIQKAEGDWSQSYSRSVQGNASIVTANVFTRIVYGDGAGGSLDGWRVDLDRSQSLPRLRPRFSGPLRYFLELRSYDRLEEQLNAMGELYYRAPPSPYTPSFFGEWWSVEQSDTLNANASNTLNPYSAAIAALPTPYPPSPATDEADLRTHNVEGYTGFYQPSYTHPSG